MIKIGKIIRSIRLAQGVSLKSLAQSVGLSSSYLSQIENDQVNINLSLIENISKELKVPVYSFFVQERLNDVNFIKKDERNIVVKKDNSKVEFLTDNKVVKYDVHKITYPTNYEANEYLLQQGDKFVYILDGEITIDFSGTRSIFMEKGDCISFSSLVPHKVITKQGAKVLVSYSLLPVTFV